MWNDIIQHKLEEEEALKIEAALIDCISGLTNKVRGRSEENSGRTSLQELKYKYAKSIENPFYFAYYVHKLHIAYKSGHYNFLPVKV